MKNMTNWRAGLVVGLLVATGMAQAVHGGERAFTGSYEALTSPKGSLEFEQWVTWATHKQDDATFQGFEFRHELEYSVSDNWMVALYLSDWQVENSQETGTDTRWNNIAAETIYMLLNPTIDPLGVAGYLEVRGGDKLASVEGKVLVQKNMGKWMAVWNGVAEEVWEGSSLDEKSLGLAESAGVSYGLKPSFRLGAELQHEVEYANSHEWQKPVVYVGPNASYRTPKWFATITPCVQVTNDDESPDYVTRLIVGIEL